MVSFLPLCHLRKGTEYLPVSAHLFPISIWNLGFLCNSIMKKSCQNAEISLLAAANNLLSPKHY